MPSVLNRKEIFGLHTAMERKYNTRDEFSKYFRERENKPLTDQFIIDYFRLMFRCYHVYMDLWLTDNLIPKIKFDDNVIDNMNESESYNFSYWFWNC